MYKVFSNGVQIYEPLLDLNIYNAGLDLELNKTGTFNFTIYPPDEESTNYNLQQNAWDSLVKMKSIITIYQDGELMYRGRIINEEVGFYNERKITCEGELAFLIDSIMRPYGTDENPWSGTPADYLTMLISNHNEQMGDDETHKFKVGNVTVTDGDTTNPDNIIYRNDSEYKNTWELITTKLIALLGGYLWVRHEPDGVYIDYLQELQILGDTTIELGVNMLDLKQSVKGEDVMSAIIPLGAKQENSEQRITIADVNGGVDYIYDQDAVNAYGWIFKTVIFENYSDKNKLKTRAEAYLATGRLIATSIEITAADLSTEEGVNPFKIGRTVYLVDNKHDFPEDIPEGLSFLIEKLNIDLNNPANNKLTVNKKVSTFTEYSTGTASSQSQIVERIDKVEQHISETGVTKNELNNAVSETVIQVTEQTSSAINQSAEAITTEVAKDYYLKADADKLAESLNTKFKQTDDEFEFRFNQFTQDLNALANGTNAQFNDIRKNIRFINGDIVLGEEGNELTLKIENDKITFLESGAEVAYFSNRKLYVLDGEFINSLKLGNYTFMPRANGNLSFKKVN